MIGHNTELLGNIFVGLGIVVYLIVVNATIYNLFLNARSERFVDSNRYRKTLALIACYFSMELLLVGFIIKYLNGM